MDLAADMPYDMLMLWYNTNPVLLYSVMYVHTLVDVHLARDIIYTSRAYATMSVSVCLSVCDGSALAHFS